MTHRFPHRKGLVTRIIRRHMTLCAVMILLAMPVHSAQPKWETSKTEHADAKSVLKDNDTEILVAPGKIIVTSGRSVQIKVYTILGQLVSRETLPAGTSHLTIQAHGVYIIRTADMTCKVAL